MAVPSGPKGTRDFFPEEMAFQQFIFDSWKTTSHSYGFEQFEGPLFEHLDVYKKKSGDEIEKQLYAFKDKGDRDIALRPELTPTLARMVASKGTNLKKPLRWYSIPRLFRYEKMQKGRLREFFQLNMDIIGIEDVTADAELIAASIQMMKNLGFTSDDFMVRISSRNLLEEMFEYYGLPKVKHPSLYALLDKKHKIPEEVYNSEFEKVVEEQEVRENIKKIFSMNSLEEIENCCGENLSSLLKLKKLFTLISSYEMSDYVIFDIGVVRGLAYYTGIVFELFDKQKSMRAIAGGGRYDNLIKLYGGPPTPAVGFAAGDVVLGEFLKEKGLKPPKPPRSDVYIIACEDLSYGEKIQIAQKLRDKEIKCEFALKEGINITKQLKLANAAGAKYALFAGGVEAEQKKIRLKNMQSGEEELIGIESYSDRIPELLKLQT
ncbi:Histidyl-tRNA synthetase [Chitinispirillum alkaliphilum]|nr:Histidyl-tRNA synthetase [Chitinispirillum alkaliphilum]